MKEYYSLTTAHLRVSKL